MTDSIERIVDLAAPVERVWRAISESSEFGAWFGVALDTPFVAGETARGRITHPGYEHLAWTVEVVEIDPPRLFSFTWHPYAVNPDKDYSGEAPTLVTFHLEPHGERTRLTITESGFDTIPAERRDEALRMNAGGWDAQVTNIAQYLDG